MHFTKNWQRGAAMRTIQTDQVRDLVRGLFLRAQTELPPDVRAALQQALTIEKSAPGRRVLAELLENERIARTEKIPICQDCGLPVLFLEVGEEIRFEGPSLIESVNEGIRRATEEGFLRPMVVDDPLYRRENTGDNTPAIVHPERVPGDFFRIIAFPKGMGGESASTLTMLRPLDGEEAVARTVLDTVDRFGANACPPLVVGVGIGGNFETAPLLAKKALLRPVGTRNAEKGYARLEKRLLEEINGLGIGPAGYGGTVTALDVLVEFAPTHAAGLPVAVNLCCHACRRAEGTL